MPEKLEPVWKTLMREAPQLLPPGFVPPDENQPAATTGRPTPQDILHGKAEGYNTTVDLTKAANSTTAPSGSGLSIERLQRALDNATAIADSFEAALMDVREATTLLREEAAGLAHVLANAAGA